MAEVPTLSLASSAQHIDVRALKRRFLGVNNERLERVRESLRPEQRAFIDLLPLLFHGNHAELPGYVKKAPTGIADFSASKRTVEAAGKLVRKFTFRRRALRLYAIQGVYLMGSTGTVAYSDKSDFDIWICHHPELGEAQVAALREKAEAIGAWAGKLGLEVKFFVMEAGGFDRGAIEALSMESSGSAQYMLLLEEFYRTGLLLAGRFPAWWLIPPDHAGDHESVLTRLRSDGAVHDYEYIDFGDVREVPAEEFLGAALWQLNKGIDSPYKSALKLLLTEAYTCEYPSPDLLCSRFKRAVYQGVSDIDELDPYVLMMRKVEDHLTARGELQRLELARRCFYFKVNLRLSARQSVRADRRTKLMADLVTRWGWEQDHLLILDSRATWKIHRVLEERAMLVDELTRSYRNVSEFARTEARGSTIDSIDLNLLGRRLYAAFERKAGKVEIINPGISTDLTEERLSFARASDGRHEGWLLYRGDYEEAIGRRQAALKRAQSLIELVAWCHFNRIIGPQTLVTLHNGEDGVSARELLAVIDSLRRLFPDTGLPDTNMEQLRQPASVHSCGLYINLGLDPLSSHTRRGVYLTSNRSDALSYGGFWKNLALTFDLLVVTTWREVLTFRYQGEAALLECLCDYLAWSPIGAAAPPSPPVLSFSSARGMAIAHRVEELFRDTIQCFYTSPGGDSARYVVRVEHTHYLLQAENRVPRFRRAGSGAELVRVLGESQDHFSPIVFDRYAAEGSVVSHIVERNRPHVVQVFFQPHGEQADVFILDEQGSLFHQTAEYHAASVLAGQFQRFIEAVVRRCNATERAPDDLNVSMAPEFYRIRRTATGQVSTEPYTQPTQAPSDYLSIQVIGEQPGLEGPVFSLFCEGQEFSSLEYGEKVFAEVARFVLAYRRDRVRYPIYITDIDVSRSLLAGDGARLQTVHYLNYKRTIEQRLNSALQSL